MLVVSTTLCYPNAAYPTRGVFVERRLQAIAEKMRVCVIAPQPWFPFVRPTKVPTEIDNARKPPLWQPRMFYFPKLAKHWDAKFYESALVSALNQISDQRTIGIIDAHFEWPDGVGAFRAARRLGVPFVCTLRGKLVSQIKDDRKREQIVEMLHGADALIAVSQSLADLANEIAGKQLEIAVIPNGIDSAAFHRIDQDQAANQFAPQTRMALGWPAGAKVCVSVGHLQELKGFHRLVSIWPAVRRQVGDARLVLVGGSAGEPDYEWRLNRQIVSLRMADYITLAGRIPPEQVAMMLNAADLFVLASRSEGWCNAIAEALACGCPVVATDVGGNREIVVDPSLGLLVNQQAGTELEPCIVDALVRSWNRAGIAETGGKRTWQQVAEECVDVFNGVLKRASLRTPGNE